MSFTVTVVCEKTKDESTVYDKKNHPNLKFKNTAYNFTQVLINNKTQPNFSITCPYCNEVIQFDSIKGHLIETKKKPKGLFQEIFRKLRDSWEEESGNPTFYIINDQKYSLDKLQLYSLDHKIGSMIKYEDKIFMHGSGTYYNEDGKPVAYLGGDRQIFGQWYDWDNGIKLDFKEKYPKPK